MGVGGLPPLPPPPQRGEGGSPSPPAFSFLHDSEIHFNCAMISIT